MTLDEAKERVRRITEMPDLADARNAADQLQYDFVEAAARGEKMDWQPIAAEISKVRPFTSASNPR
jgi:hypothetical protein